MPQPDFSAVFVHAGRLYAVRHYRDDHGVRALSSSRWCLHRRWHGVEEMWGEGLETCCWWELPEAVRREAIEVLEIGWKAR